MGPGEALYVFGRRVMLSLRGSLACSKFRSQNILIGRSKRHETCFGGISKVKVPLRSSNYVATPFARLKRQV